jgi:hypothetical protein
MAKINWNRQPRNNILNSEYYTDPKKGFDQKWYVLNENIKKNLGIHIHHNWLIISKPTGPHTGRIVCNTCNGKFISWLPKGYISSNT